MEDCGKGGRDEGEKLDFSGMTALFVESGIQPRRLQVQQKLLDPLAAWLLLLCIIINIIIIIFLFLSFFLPFFLSLRGKPKSVPPLLFVESAGKSNFVDKKYQNPMKRP
jgi:amino acid transporter